MYLIPALLALLAAALFAASRTVTGDVATLETWMRQPVTPAGA
jgi:hypothetical protein